MWERKERVCEERLKVFHLCMIFINIHSGQETNAPRKLPDHIFLVMLNKLILPLYTESTKQQTKLL